MIGTWWKDLLSLLSVIWTRDPQEVERRRELRRIRVRLRSLQPPVYRAAAAQVLPAFAEQVLAVARLLKPICLLLQKTTRNSDPRLADRYQDFLLEALLPEDLRRMFGRLQEQAVQDRLSGSDSPEEEMERLKQEHAEFVRELSASALERVDEEMADLEAVADLCRYDYMKLLRMFDPYFPADPLASPAESVPQAVQYEFLPVEGGRILGELQDFYFVLAPVRLLPGLEGNLDTLLLRLQREKAEHSRETLLKTCSRLRGFLERALAGETVLDLIRILQNDPAFQPEAGKERLSFREIYLERFSRRFREVGEQILWERREKALADEIRELFQDADLLEIIGYDDEIAATLAERGFSTFTQVRTLRLLRSFVCSLFEGNIRDPVKRLLVEGYFADRTFQESLSDTFLGCETIRDSIDRFEQELRGGELLALQTLRQYLKQDEQGKPIGPVLNKMVDTIDYSARKLVEEGAGLFYRLGNLLYEILGDLKKSAPERVTNIKVIGGNYNRDFLQGLLAGYGDLRSFVRIMSRFTVLQPAFRPGDM